MGKLFALVVVVVLCFAGWNAWQEHQQVAPFSSALKSYLTTSGRTTGDVQLVKGKKVLPVNVDAESVDRAFFQMDEAVRPRVPADVGAVARVKYSSEAIGEYGRFGSGGSGTGYVWLANVQVVDLATQAVVAHNVFRGTDPPSSKKGRGDEHGSRPSDQIATWLAQVAR